MMRRLVLFSLSLIAIGGLLSCGGKKSPTSPKTLSLTAISGDKQEGQSARRSRIPWWSRWQMSRAGPWPGSRWILPS
jgi:hypothetical protein